MTVQGKNQEKKKKKKKKADGDQDGSVQALSKGLRYAFSQGHSESVTSVDAFCGPDNKWILVTGSTDGTAKLWTTAGECVQTFSGHASAVTAVAAFDEGGGLWRIATGSEDKTAKVWKTNGELLATLAGNGHTRRVSSVAIRGGEGQKRLLTASGDKSIKLWSTMGEGMATYKGHQGGITSLATYMEKSGQFKLLTGSDDSTAKVWSAAGKCEATLKGHADAVEGITAFEIKPGQWQVLTGSKDHTAKIWTLSGKCVSTLVGHIGSVNAVSAFEHLPGQWNLLTASSDQTARVWAADGTWLGTLIGHADSVTALTAYEASPGNWRVLTASEDGTARIWSVDGKARGQLRSLPKLDVLSRVGTTFVTGLIVLSFPFDPANKWAKPVRPFKGALPALRLALPSMKNMYATTFSMCSAFTIVYLTVVLGNVHGWLSRWHASLEVAADDVGISEPDSSPSTDTSVGSRLGSRVSAGFVKRLQTIVKIVVLLGTIVLLPAIVQTFVMAIDCSMDNNATVTGSLVWDRDPTVECFVGDHAADYATPTFVLLPLYLFAALRLSIEGGHIERLPFIFKGLWLKMFTCGQHGCRDTWWGESTPLPAASLSTTFDGGRFSLWLQVTKILMSAATDLLNTHQVTLGIVFTLLVGSSLVIAPRLPIYSVTGTQAAYEALLALNVWTCALGTVTAYVDDETNTSPALVWYCGALILPPLWYKGRTAGCLKRCHRNRKVAPSPLTAHKSTAKQRERTPSHLPSLTHGSSGRGARKGSTHGHDPLPPLKHAKGPTRGHGHGHGH